MGDTACERALARVLAYLNGMNVPLTKAASISAMKLVEEALGQDSVEVYVYIMDRIAERFVLPEFQLPPLTPPILRGSIGYGES